MKKLLFLLVGLLLVFGGMAAFGQETTWINPFSLAVPGSMLSDVSAGLFYDQIDILFLSPAELHNYKGTSIYTAYGNYEWNWAQGVATTPSIQTATVNPFSTTTLSTANTGAYQFGIAMPIAKYVAGIAGGFNTSLAQGMTIGALPYGEWSNTSTQAVDANGNNVADYSYTNTQSYNDTTGTTYVALATGIDLNFMGLSLAAYVNGNDREVGGSYTYAYTQGTDTTFYPEPANVVSAKTADYGSSKGTAASFPTSSGTTWSLMARGEYPLTVAGISLPVTGMLTTASTPAVQATPTFNPLESVSITTLNVGGTAAKTSTLSYTRGWTTNTADPTTESGVIPNTTALTNAQLRTLAGNQLTAMAGGALAMDMTKYANSNFLVGLGGTADPLFKLSDRATVKTRAQLQYAIAFQNYAEPGTASISYSEANTAATNSTYSVTITNSGNPMSGTTNFISAELGGILELNDSTGFITVGMGLFYDPSFNLTSSTLANTTTTVTSSWTDTTNTDPQAAALTAIAPGVAQGTRTDTTTQTYAGGGKGSDNIISNTFYLPMSARLNIVKDKLALVGGYTGEFTVTTEYKSTPSSVSTTSTTVATTAGTNVYTTAATAASTTSTGTTDVVTSTGAQMSWNGIMNFMLRFTPVPSVTADLLGKTIMAGLSAANFFGGTGFDPGNFISSLGISVTFHVD